MLYDFNNCKPSNRNYGGNAGAKLGIVFNNENWFLKFPQSTRGNRVQEISYTTSPLSEYIGSQIYAVLGLPVHDTLLGEYSGKIVVACKDFLMKGEILDEFNKIKNTYFPGMDDLMPESSNSGSSTDIDEIKTVMENNPVFLENPQAKERFWDMFVVDALIGNRDRNNGNWGFVKHDDQSYSLAPVFDNGNSFANKAGDEKMERLANDVQLLEHSSLTTGVCIFSENGKPINPYKFICESEDLELTRALIKIVPRIDINKIHDIIDSIPNEFRGVPVISDVRKDYYKKLLSIRYEKCLLSAYQKILERENKKDTLNYKIADAENKSNSQNKQNQEDRIKEIGKELVQKHIGAIRE